MLSGVRFRAYPTAAQAAVLRQWIGHQRFIYNSKVRELRYWHRFARSSLALTGQRPLPDQAYSQFIGADTRFLQEVPSQILRNGAYRFAQGCARALQGISGFPTIRKPHGRQSVMITSELFEFVEAVDPATGEVGHALMLGTAKFPFPLGRLQFHAHAPYALPRSISVSVDPAGRWFVSFCFDAPNLDAAGKEVVLRTPAELAYEFNNLPDAELEALTEGCDRGVKQPLMLSSGEAFTIPPVCAARIARKAKRAAGYQRRMARQTKGSCGYRKTKRKKAKLQQYGADVRQDFSHKVSCALAESPKKIFVFEDLRIKNMTAAPAHKPVAPGRWAPNGSAAKAGLNKALLGSALGLIREYTAYKAARRNKLVLRVNPRYTSQECAECGHVAAENRPTQAGFCCVACGHADHADRNAARVIKARGIQLIRDGRVGSKTRKTARVRGNKQQVGPVRPEPGATPTLVENVSDAVGGQAANSALFDETGNRHYSANGA